MRELKILHIADVHFDRSLSHLDSKKAALRKSETLINFKNVIDKFLDADVILIAGDLFDDDCSRETFDFVNSVFRNHAKQRFFIALGNHDNLSKLTIQRFASDLPDNVRVFKDTIEKISLDEFNVDIYGVSFSSDYSFASLINNFTVEDNNRINIFVTHGDVSGTSDYNPMSIAEIGATKADYIALGHVHKFDGIHKISGTTYAYSGVFEPGGFDETGECGVIFGSVSKANTLLQFYPVSLRQYKKLDIDISDFTSNEEIFNHINKNICPEYLYKINLTGTRQCSRPPKVVYESLIDCFYKEINDLSEKNDSILNYLDEVSLRGKTAIELQKYIDCDEKVYKAACDILTCLMCGE